MKVIYQLIEKETGKRCEEMAAEFPELQRILADHIPESERWKYYVLLLMEEREMMDDAQESVIDKRMLFSRCPLIALQAFINLGAKDNAA